MNEDWSIERILTTADKAVGVDVLTHLHDEMGLKAGDARSRMRCGAISD